MPGLDGTGKLFEPITPYLENHFSLNVIQYEDQDSLEELVELVESQLPSDEPVSLVAESFSSPIAIEVLARNNFKFAASVLSTGFCRPPYDFVSPLVRLVPDKLFGIEVLSKIALEIFGIEKGTDDELGQECMDALSTVSPSTIKRRMEIVGDVNLCNSLSKIEIPILYIRASRDRIIPKGKSDEVVSKLVNAEEVIVEGPHLILQSNPKACADHIIRHMTSNERMQSDLKTATPFFGA